MKRDHVRHREVRKLYRQMQAAGTVFVNRFSEQPIDNADVIIASEVCFLPGSKLVVCEHCGITLFLYDVEMQQRYPGVPVLCLRCATAHIKKKTRGTHA